VYTWAMFDASGNETGTTGDFTTQTDAEEWFGTNWQAMAQGGTSDVALRDIENGSEVYRMGLAPEA
jgi:hypothetical protein